MSITVPSTPRAPTIRPLVFRAKSQRPGRPEPATMRPEESERTNVPRNQVPRWWVGETGGGTYPEFLVWQWLRDKGYLPGVDFQFQSSFFGGRRDLGGLVADFILDTFTPPIVIRVQGEYWHVLPGRRERDFFEMVRLNELGFTVVDAWENDLVERLNFTMEAALRGVSIRETAR